MNVSQEQKEQRRKDAYNDWRERFLFKKLKKKLIIKKANQLENTITMTLGSSTSLDKKLLLEREQQNELDEIEKQEVENWQKRLKKKFVGEKTEEGQVHGLRLLVQRSKPIQKTLKCYSKTCMG